MSLGDGSADYIMLTANRTVKGWPPELTAIRISEPEAQARDVLSEAGGVAWNRPSVGRSPPTPIYCEYARHGR